MKVNKFLISVLILTLLLGCCGVVSAISSDDVVGDVNNHDLVGRTVTIILPGGGLWFWSPFNLTGVKLVKSIGFNNVFHFQVVNKTFNIRMIGRPNLGIQTDFYDFHKDPYYTSNGCKVTIKIE